MIVSTIVGSRHYTGAVKLLSSLPIGSLVTLRRQPSNPFDPNAIAVYVGETQVGHVARMDAATVAVIMDSGTSVTAHLHPISPVIKIEWDEPDTISVGESQESLHKL
jgi:hypothetical protein